MSSFEKESVVNIAKGMTEEQKSMALEVFPTKLLFKELDRRTVLADTTINKLKGELDSISIDSDMSLEEAQEKINTLKKILRA